MRSYVKRRLYVVSVLALLAGTLVLRKTSRISSLPLLTDDLEIIDYSGDQLARRSADDEIADEAAAATAITPIDQEAALFGSGRQRYLINSSGCQIPDMQAFSESAKEHWRPPEPLTCTRRNSRGYRVSRAVNDDASEGNLVPEVPPPGLECCYRHILRRRDDDDEYRLSDVCLPMEALLSPENPVSGDPENKVPEFVRVTCHKPGNSDEWMDDEYWSVHSFVPVKEHVEWRCDQAPKEDDQLNVVILGVDSLSRLNFVRHLPRTYSLLTGPQINATVLLGYNKVADNTFPNLMPLLVGHSIDELGNVCKWPEPDSWKYTFDTCPIIWKSYAKKGYRTMYGEECPHLSTFNFQKAGFTHEPTDYYLRPLLLAANEELGHMHADNCDLCLGPRSSVAVLLNYATQFVHRFSNKKHFAFSWATSLTHDGQNMAGLADEPFSKTLQRLLDHGDLSRTALFFVSDHGVRTGSFRLTPQGRMEERLPFFALSLPQWFQQRYPAAVANLRENARARLTTPFDVHETLRDLLLPAKFMRDEAIKRRVQELGAQATKPRGISLFLDIPEERTCDSAGIPRHWCTCLSYKPLPLSDPNLQEAAEAFVYHINDRFLAPHNNCQPLSLARVVEARLGAPRNSDDEEKKTAAGIKDYAMTIETQPGGALFEGAVRSYRRRGRRNRIRYEVADTISRLNRYGNQSACIDDWVVKLYCYCK